MVADLCVVVVGNLGWVSEDQPRVGGESDGIRLGKSLDELPLGLGRLFSEEATFQPFETFQLEDREDPGIG